MEEEYKKTFKLKYKIFFNERNVFSFNLYTLEKLANI